MMRHGYCDDGICYLTMKEKTFGWCCDRRGARLTARACSLVSNLGKCRLQLQRTSNKRKVPRKCLSEKDAVPGAGVCQHDLINLPSVISRRFCSVADLLQEAPGWTTTRVMHHIQSVDKNTSRSSNASYLWNEWMWVLRKMLLQLSVSVLLSLSCKHNSKPTRGVSLIISLQMPLPS